MTDADKPNEGELILHQTQEGAVRIEVLYESETFWLNQKKIAEPFGVDLRTISEHLRKIYAAGGLTEQATLRKIRRVQREGNRKSQEGQAHILSKAGGCGTIPPCREPHEWRREGCRSTFSVAARNACGLGHAEPPLCRSPASLWRYGSDRTDRRISAHGHH